MADTCVTAFFFRRSFDESSNLIGSYLSELERKMLMRKKSLEDERVKIQTAVNLALQVLNPTKQCMEVFLANI